MIPRIIDLEFLLPRVEDSSVIPCDSRSFPWPGVSVNWYLIGFLEASPKEGSLTERKRLEPIGTVRERVMVADVEVWDVCVCRGGFDGEEDFCSSCYVCF